MSGTSTAMHAAHDAFRLNFTAPQSRIRCAHWMRCASRVREVSHHRAAQRRDTGTRHRDATQGRNTGTQCTPLAGSALSPPSPLRRNNPVPHASSLPLISPRAAAAAGGAGPVTRRARGEGQAGARGTRPRRARGGARGRPGQAPLTSIRPAPAPAPTAPSTPTRSE